MELELLLNTIKNLVESDVEVTSKIIQKGNINYTGISIGKGNMRPIIYVEDYVDLLQKQGYLTVASKMIEDCSTASQLEIDMHLCFSWDYVKNNLILCIAPTGTNNEYITIPYLDLELYFKVNLENAGTEATYRITDYHLDMWNKTKEELLQIALETNDYSSTSMIDTTIKLLEESGATDEEIEEMKRISDNNQFIITNANKKYGAAAIYKKEILKEVADRFESDLYIIPSSIHELIVLPINDYPKEAMNYMIREVNMNEVDPEEVLSNHVYIFRRDTMEIEW